MKKEKQPLVKEIYVRIYDKKTAEKYREIKETKRKDVSDNEFAQELMRLGLGVLSASKESAETFIDASTEIKRMLGVIIRELRKQSDNNSITSVINNKKNNAIYNILVAQCLGDTVTENEIENGMYDALPERFVEELKTNGDKDIEWVKPQTF